MAKAGDRVKVVSVDETYEGVVVPNEETKNLVLKLDSGYNVGIERSKIKKIEVLKAYKAGKKKEIPVKHDKNKPTIGVLHTGGTIASKVDYETGGVIAHFTAEDLIAMVPELAEMANIKTELVANMMSEDMNFAEHQKIADAVEKYAKKGVDGIIIGHGTDTLAYTSAALSFMFEKINIPVLIVGSQRSSDRGSTDAISNLICAATFIVKTDFAGVAICMHYTANDDKCAIIAGTKARKLHTSRRDAFKAVNDSPIALIDYKTRNIEFLKKDYAKRNKKGKAESKTKMNSDVGLLKTYPNMKTELFDFFTKKYKAFVIEGTGLGHAPTNLGVNLKNYEILKDYIKKGGIVAITSQCVFGRVHPNVYTNLRRLSDIGCIFCEDMFAETAYIKLAWLMANYPTKVKELMGKNLRGEITPRTMPEEFLE